MHIFNNVYINLILVLIRSGNIRVLGKWESMLSFLSRKVCYRVKPIQLKTAVIVNRWVQNGERKTLIRSG